MAVQEVDSDAGPRLTAPSSAGALARIGEISDCVLRFPYGAKFLLALFGSRI